MDLLHIRQEFYTLFAEHNVPINIKFEIIKVELSPELKKPIDTMIEAHNLLQENYIKLVKNRFDISDFTDWLSSSDRNPNGL